MSRCDPVVFYAPNPLLIISSKRGTDDEEFPLDEAEKSHQWARHVYRLLGAEDAVDHYESTTGHGYQDDKREQIYRAVERWLKPPRAFDGKELAAKIETVEDLRCALPADNLTFRETYAQWLNGLPRTKHHHDVPFLREFLHERLGWPQSLASVKAEKVGVKTTGAWRAEFWTIESEAGIGLPAVFICSRDGFGTVTLIPGRDKQAAARGLERGDAVLAFDLRGIGELRHGKGGYWARMAGKPWPEALGDNGNGLANWSWFAGPPVVGQWALDLVQAARFCREQLGATAVRVDAENHFGWPALLAGAAAPEHLPSGRAQIPWASLHEVIRARGDAALSDVPGLLEHLDVSQLRDLWPGGEIGVKP